MIVALPEMEIPKGGPFSDRAIKRMNDGPRNKWNNFFDQFDDLNAAQQKVVRENLLRMLGVSKEGF